jgi:hypothetical protein
MGVPTGFPSFPRAGLAALLIISTLDAVGIGVEQWKAVADTRGRLGLIERGVVADRLELFRASPRPGRPLAVFVLGTSRAKQAIRKTDDLGVPVDYAMLTHPGMRPFEMLNLSEEIARCEPDIAVLVISSFDMHRPFSVGPQTAPGSFSALLDLAQIVGPGFVWKEREVMLQLLLSSVLDIYRYRSVFAGLGLGRFARFGALPSGSGIARGLTPLVTHTLVNMELALAETRELFPFVPDQTLRQQIMLVQGISVGTHVPIQRGLLRRACEVLVEAGCELVVVEGPLHPQAGRYHDSSVRRHFLTFADELATNLGAQVLTLDDTGPFLHDDFADLTHLNQQGSDKLVAVLRQTLAPLAASRWRGRAGEPPAR